MKKINIRYNTNFPEKSQHKWRVIVDGIEHLVDNVRIETPTYTTSEFIEGLGLKHHITTDANYFEVITAGELNGVAYIK
jgi:hypothetical protein